MHHPRPAEPAIPVEPPLSPAPVAPPPSVLPSVERGRATYRYLQPPFETAGRVVFAGVVLLMFGAVAALAGAGGAVLARSLRRVFDDALRAEGIRIEPTALVAVVVGFFVALLVVGILHIAAAAGVFSHKTWGRALGFVLSVLGVLAGSFLLGRAVSAEDSRAAAVGGIGLLLPYGLSLLALVFAGGHFRSRRRRR